MSYVCCISYFFFFQAEDGIRDLTVTGVQTCALPIFWPDLDTRRVEPGSGAPGKKVRTDLPRSHQPSPDGSQRHHGRIGLESGRTPLVAVGRGHQRRSEAHTSELQSQSNIVCRLLLEKNNRGERPRLHPRSRGCPTGPPSEGSPEGTACRERPDPTAQGRAVPCARPRSPPRHPRSVRR